MTSTDFLKVRFRHNQFEKAQFGQITQLQEPQRLAIFENVLLK